MLNRRQINQDLTKLSLTHRETGFEHQSYDEDLHQYELMRRGDLSCVEEGKRLFEGPTTGTISDTPVRNYQYLFVSAATLACRFCIQGGLNPEVSYNLSDLYIRQVDKCRSVEEIFTLHDTMFRDYALRMQEVSKESIFSRPVRQAMDYIEQHLQDELTVDVIAEAVGLSPTYLSTVFKKETCLAVSDYVRRKRIDTAKMLLEYTGYSCLEISEYLHFSSDSHFSRIFKIYTGLTPREYRKNGYRKQWG